MSRAKMTVQAERIERAERMLAGVKGGAGKALSRSMNRAIDGARANVVRAVREEYNASPTAIRKTMRVNRAKPGNLEAELVSSGPVLPLDAFDVSPKTVNGKRRTPIRVGVKKGTRHALDRGFIARVGDGKPKVFERIGSARLPIRRLFGPSVPQMIGNDVVIGGIEEKAIDTMNARLDHEVNRLLEGGR